jgi:RNA polymerase sigma-70 factor (ECF subfamily)
MEHLNVLIDPASRINRNINIRAARLAHSGAAPGLDAEDIAQELREEVLRRADLFDPERACFDTFVDRIVKNRIADLARQSQAAKASRKTQSFETPILGKNGEEGLTLADTLSETSPTHGVDDFASHHGAGLKSDVATFLASLCPSSRRIAIAVSQGSVSDAARILGLHRSTIYERLSAIRKAAIAMGLDGYFEASTRQFAPRVGK